MDARRIRFDLLDPHADRYYGAVIEASRGCPFLCEFCDIRILPGNDQTNTKDIVLLVEEIDEYARRGIKKFQIACDNFIGDPRWAERFVDAVLEWKERTGAEFSGEASSQSRLMQPAPGERRNADPVLLSAPVGSPSALAGGAARSTT